MEPDCSTARLGIWRLIWLILIYQHFRNKFPSHGWYEMCGHTARPRTLTKQGDLLSITVKTLNTNSYWSPKLRIRWTRCKLWPLCCPWSIVAPWPGHIDPCYPGPPHCPDRRIRMLQPWQWLTLGDCVYVEIMLDLYCKLATMRPLSAARMSAS